MADQYPTDSTPKLGGDYDMLVQGQWLTLQNCRQNNGNWFTADMIVGDKVSRIRIRLSEVSAIVRKSGLSQQSIQEVAADLGA